MTRSEFVFLAIDYLCYPGQNYKRYKGIIKSNPMTYDTDFPGECECEMFVSEEAKKSGKKLPVIINIHGGGFVKGDMRYRISLCQRYAKEGYAVLNVNYRLSPKYQFPCAIQDCMKALAYLKNLEEEYNLDLTKVCVSGDSSGAYCATMMVAISYDDELRQRLDIPELVVKPTLLLSFCGPYDLIASISLTKLPFDLVWDIGRCYLDTDTFKLKKDFSNVNDSPYLDVISPINHANENWCPSFLVLSKKDFFCKGQGELLAEKLNNSGVTVDTYTATNLLNNHCFHLEFWRKASKECFKKVFAFLEKHLKG